MANITQDDLLQFLYNELPPEKTKEMQQELDADTELQERLNVLKAAKTRLEKIKLLSPDERSIDKIMNYSERGIEELHHGK